MSVTTSGFCFFLVNAKNGFLPFFADFLKKWPKRIQPAQDCIRGAEMAADNDEHDDRSDKYLTPYNALIVQFVWCVIVFIIVGGAFSSDSFKVLSDFNTYIVWIFYFFASVGLLVSN